MFRKIIFENQCLLPRGFANSSHSCTLGGLSSLLETLYQPREFFRRGHTFHLQAGYRNIKSIDGNPERNFSSALSLSRWWRSHDFSPLRIPPEYGNTCYLSLISDHIVPGRKGPSTNFTVLTGEAAVLEELRCELVTVRSVWIFHGTLFLEHYFHRFIKPVKPAVLGIKVLVRWNSRRSIMEFNQLSYMYIERKTIYEIRNIYSV